MQKKINRNYIVLFLKGMAMGAADVVPGVSGGTIAFISGIYEELLESINNVNLKALKKWKQEGIKSFWAHINGNFLTALFLGIGVSVISLAKGISWLLNHETVLLWSFFFGLVLASVVFIGKSIKNKKPEDYIMAVIGIAIAIGIGELGVVENSQQPLYLFLSGALAICAMILPGISGAFILVLLGSYEPILNAVHQRDLLIIATVGAGCIIGLASFSRILKWTLNHFKNQTLSILMGFIIGSLSKIWPWKEVVSSRIVRDKEIVLASKNVLPWDFSGNTQIIAASLLAIFGFSLIFILEKTANKKTT